MQPSISNAQQQICLHGSANAALPTQLVTLRGRPCYSVPSRFLADEGFHTLHSLVVCVWSCLEAPGRAAQTHRHLTMGSGQSCSHSQLAFGHGCGWCAGTDPVITRPLSPLFVARYVEIQSGDSYHLKATLVRQSARSSYTCNEATVGAAISRHDLAIQQVSLGNSVHVAP